MTAYYDPKTGVVAEGVGLPPATNWIDASAFSPAPGGGTKSDQGYVFGASWGFMDGAVWRHATVNDFAGAEERTDWFYPWEMANADGTHKYQPTDAVVTTAVDAYRNYWTGRALTDWRTSYNYRLTQAKLDLNLQVPTGVVDTALWASLSAAWGSELAEKAFLDAHKDVPSGTTWVIFKWVYDRADPVFPTDYGLNIPGPTPVFRGPAMYMPSDVLVVTGTSGTSGSQQAPPPSQLTPPAPPSNNQSSMLVLLGLAALLLFGKKK